MDEAIIIINGKELSYQESMTLRVAMGSFYMGLNYNGLGDDKHGKTMTEAYMKNVTTILAKMSAK